MTTENRVCMQVLELLKGPRFLILLLSYKLTKRTFREIQAAPRRWRQGLKSEQGWRSILMTVVGMVLLCPWAFDQGASFGLTFVGAAIAAIVLGHIFTNPSRLIVIAIALVISKVVMPELLGTASDALLAGNVMAAVVASGLVILFWGIKRRFENTHLVKPRLPNQGPLTLIVWWTRYQIASFRILRKAEN